VIVLQLTGFRRNLLRPRVRDDGDVLDQSADAERADGWRAAGLLIGQVMRDGHERRVVIPEELQKAVALAWDRYGNDGHANNIRPESAGSLPIGRETRSVNSFEVGGGVTPHVMSACTNSAAGVSGAPPGIVVSLARVVANRSHVQRPLTDHRVGIVRAGGAADLVALTVSCQADR
jgi:hypothetical protein